MRFVQIWHKVTAVWNPNCTTPSGEGGKNGNNLDFS